MPGTDFTIATIKVNSAVTSSSPQIKLESQEKVITSDMTQSPTPREEAMTGMSPTQVSEESSKREGSPEGAVRRTEVTRDHVLNGNGNMETYNAASELPVTASCETQDSHVPTEEFFSNLRRISSCAQPETKIKTEPFSDAGQTTPFVMKERESSETRNELLSSSNNLGFHRRISCPPNIRLPSEQVTATSGETTAFKCTSSSTVHYQNVPATMSSMVSAERKHECERCGISFRSHKTYMVHVQHYCSGKRLEMECKICGAKFDSEKTLSIHMEVHDPQYVCLICTKRLSHLGDCKKHMIQHADECEGIKEGNSSTLSCPSCGIECNGKSILMEHMWTNHFTISNTAACKQYYCETMPLLRVSPPIPTPTDDDNIVNELHRRKKVSQQHSDVPIAGALCSPKTPTRCREPDLQNISPPTTTSTPVRPVPSVEVISNSAFSCIVCSAAFPDVISLQHHLLTAHAFSAGSRASPIRGTTPNESENLVVSKGKQMSRKISTVSAPQLSLLSETTKFVRHTTTPHEIIEEEPEMLNKLACNSPTEVYVSNEASNKKRKDRSLNDMVDIPHSGSLKRIRRDMISPKRQERSPFVNDVEAVRRVSCPVVSHKLSESDQREPYGNVSPLHERTCVPCDIKFSSVNNYRAHKKYYCASRHIQKSADDKSNEFLPTGLNLEPTQTGKLRKRNAGNKSSITSRKKSHLIPLETVRGSSPISDTLDANKMPSNRKSCPSEVASYLIPNNRHSPDADSSSPSNVQSIPNQKKHLCQECNIWYSKIDTYMAHKKYYCESRRKERGAQRVVNASSRATLKRKSESSLREPISRGENSSGASDRRVWSPQRNSPSTDGDEDKTGKGTENELAENGIQNPINFDHDSLPFPSYNPSAIMGHEMLARLSLMHYLAMVRSQEICGNGFPLFPSLPAINLQATTSGGTSKIHRRSVADLRSPASSSSSDFNKEQRLGSLATRRYSEVNRDAVEKRMIIKQESPREVKTSSPVGRARGSPLDLSNKSAAEDAEHRVDVSPERFPYPTIDLRTTGHAIKREPRIIGLASEESDKAQHESDNENNSNNVDEEKGTSNSSSAFSVSESIVIPLQSQDPGHKSRAQQCKNCNARFTSLSTFIAHKKYYCSGSNSSGLRCNDTKAAQMAH